MKIYIGASFVAQKRLRPIRDQLFHKGHAVIGSWLDEITKPSDMPGEVFDKKLATKDLQEIREAECFILDTNEASTTGGRMIEFGFALANMKLIYHVGKDNSIFMHLADKHFDTWEELYKYFDDNHITEAYEATGMEDREFTSTDTAYDVYGIRLTHEERDLGWYHSLEGEIIGEDNIALFSSEEAAETFIRNSHHIQNCTRDETTYVPQLRKAG